MAASNYAESQSGAVEAPSAFSAAAGGRGVIAALGGVGAALLAAGVGLAGYCTTRQQAMAELDRSAPAVLWSDKTALEAAPVAPVLDTYVRTHTLYEWAIAAMALGAGLLAAAVLLRRR
jgi:hypothetical protein